MSYKKDSKTPTITREKYGAKGALKDDKAKAAKDEKARRSSCLIMTRHNHDWVTGRKIAICSGSLITDRCVGLVNPRIWSRHNVCHARDIHTWDYS